MKDEEEKKNVVSLSKEDTLIELGTLNIAFVILWLLCLLLFFVFSLFLSCIPVCSVCKVSQNTRASSETSVDQDSCAVSANEGIDHAADGMCALLDQEDLTTAQRAERSKSASGILLEGNN